jgi:hypothetical protein
MSKRWSTVVVPVNRFVPVVTPAATSPVMVLKLAAEGINSNFKALHRVLAALANKYAAPGNPTLVVDKVSGELLALIDTLTPLPVAPVMANMPAVCPAVLLMVMEDTNFCVSPRSPS